MSAEQGTPRSGPLLSPDLYYKAGEEGPGEEGEWPTSSVSRKTSVT